MIIGIERIAGLYAVVVTGDSSKAETAGLIDVAGGAGYNGLFDPFAVPQLSAHGVIGKGLTLGGSVGFMTVSQSNSDATLDVLTLGPRIGYVAALSARVGFWIKGGLSYASISSGSSSRSSASWTDVTIDPMFMFFPVPHVALLLGPVADIGIVASDESDLFANGKIKFSTVGAAVGLGAYL